MVLCFCVLVFFFFKQKTAYEMRISDWSSDVCSSDLILELNAAHRSWLSNDLGAIAGFLFDVGKGRVPLPPAGDNAAARAAWATDLAQVRADAADLRLRAIEAAEDQSHTQIQGWLRDLGRALGFAVWIASNDRARPYADGRL